MRWGTPLPPSAPLPPPSCCSGAAGAAPTRWSAPPGRWSSAAAAGVASGATRWSPTGAVSAAPKCCPSPASAAPSAADSTASAEAASSEYASVEEQPKAPSADDGRGVLPTPPRPTVEKRVSWVDESIEVSLSEVETVVGLKPITTWRDEWVDAWLERMGLDDTPPNRSLFEGAGAESIETNIKNRASSIQWKVDHGMPRREAEALTLLSACIAEPMAAAVSERSARYAASTHMLCGALAEQARRLEKAAPPVFYHLTGTFGLATADPAWEALVTGGSLRVPGLTLRTNGVSRGLLPDAKILGERGFSVGASRNGIVRYELQESDVVCFRSAPADTAGCHSLVPINGLGGHALPPLATVTLERVQGPGEWQARPGIKVQRTLFTVAVTYGIGEAGSSA